MTLLAVWASAEFLLFGCDSQFSDGTTGLRRSGTKVHQIGDLPIVWGLAGNSDLYEVFGAFLDKNLPQWIEQDIDVTEISDHLGGYVAHINKSMIDRGASVRGGRDSGDGITFMMAGDFGGRLQIIHVDWVGSPAIFPGRTTGNHAFVSIGAAATTADTLYRVFTNSGPEKYSLEKAQVMMTRIMLETIALAADKGVNEPIYIWRLTKDGTEELSASHLDALKVQVTEWRQQSNVLPDL